eukprot:2229391-Rhodomonas_salina.1
MPSATAGSATGAALWSASQTTKTLACLRRTERRGVYVRFMLCWLNTSPCHAHRHTHTTHDVSAFDTAPPSARELLVALADDRHTARGSCARAAVHVGVKSQTKAGTDQALDGEDAQRVLPHMRHTRRSALDMGRQ